MEPEPEPESELILESEPGSIPEPEAELELEFDTTLHYTTLHYFLPLTLGSKKLSSNPSNVVSVSELAGVLKEC